MAREKAKGQQAEKLFLGSLRASRAIKNYYIILDVATVMKRRHFQTMQR